jgi:hypothetical protein
VSLEIILIPLAIGAVSAINAARDRKRDQSATSVHVQTRMKDESLLLATLTEHGALVDMLEKGLNVSGFQGLDFILRQGSDGLWSAIFPNETNQEQAVEVIRTLDAVYGLAVQTMVIKKLKERAQAHGMTIDSETVQDDASVTFVMTVSDSV